MGPGTTNMDVDWSGLVREICSRLFDALSVEGRRDVLEFVRYKLRRENEQRE